MKLNRLFTLALMAAGTLAMSAQGIEFMPEGSLLKDAVTKAKAENKMVFLDCYTSWCGPCRMMSNTIFPTKEVGDFMNPSYVSIKIDMEKGEGPALAKRLEISAYPTFVIFDKAGRELGRAVGGSDAAKFIERVKENSVAPVGPSLEERYAAGERSREFLLAYFDDLNKKYRKQQRTAIAEMLLDGKAETFASDSALVYVFANGINDPYHPAFIYAASHPEALKPIMGENAYNNKIRGVLSENCNRFLKKNANGTLDFDKEGFDRYLAFIKDNNMSNPLEYKLRTLIVVAERNSDWKTYVDVIDEWTSDKSVDMTDFTLAFRASNIVDRCDDKKQLKRLKKIVQKRCDDLKSGRRPEQTFPANRQPPKSPTVMLKEAIEKIDAKK